MAFPAPVTKRVLVVDDSAHVRDAVCAYLRRKGHEVHEAADGRSAIALAIRVRPDAALIDLWMPAMDRYQVARRLRQELGTTPRIVAMSAHANAEARSVCLDAGFDHYLAKPIDTGFLDSWLGAGGTSG